MPRDGWFGDTPLVLSVLGLAWGAAYACVLAVFAAGLAPPVVGVAPGGTNGPAVLLASLGAGVCAAWLLELGLARGHNELGLIPFGSIGLAVVPLVAAGMSLGPALRAEAWVPVFAAGGMFLAWYALPLYRFVRRRSSPISQAGRWLGALGATLVLGAAAIVVARLAGNSGPGLSHWLALGAINAGIAWYIYFRIPEFFLRFLAWLLVKVVFRVDRRGFEHLPDEGPAVVACNHVSFADAVIIMGCSARPIRFVMDHRIFRVPVLSYIFRHTRAIPIAPAREDPALLQAAYDEVARALSDGDLVGIFPEGAITRDGEMQPFRRGLRDIVNRTPVPVVPMGLSGLWGSVFSRRHRGPARWVPRGIRPKVGLAAGRPVTPEALDLDTLHRQVLALRGPVR
jgi:hypothetical protein